MTGAARLRELLAGDELIIAPGVFDGISATLVVQLGFSAGASARPPTAFRTHLSGKEVISTERFGLALQPRSRRARTPTR
ncbi:MAG TPA: hypothetical protein VHX88_20200 [Solirubrobacteraceae bacterium]|jgi:2-methylisocitrate lyase-like PEP mutase family enzyme|nr:hypothetical protein [Solirubrobacteraceae bacterium]